MNLLNQSLSGVNINKTYENVLHHNTTNWYGNEVYKLYTGNGVVLPVGFKFIGDAKLDASPTPNKFADVIFDLQHVCCDYCSNIKNLQNINLYNSDTLTSVKTCSARTIFIDKEFGDIDKNVNTLITNNNTHVVANYKYLTSLAEQLSADYYKHNFDERVKHKDKLIYGYVNNMAGNCSLTITLTPEDVAKSNNTLTLLVLAQGTKYTGDAGHTLTLHMNGGGLKKEVTTTTYLRSYFSSDSGDSGVMRCKKNGVMMIHQTFTVTSKTSINIWLTNCDTSSLVVLRGEIATD